MDEKRHDVSALTMHPLVRDLYKRVLHAGKNYPTGIDHVKQVWKAAIRNPRNCPSCYNGGDRWSESLRAVSFSEDSNARPKKIGDTLQSGIVSPKCDREIRAAVARGRHMVKEMVGVSQLKKYRSMRKRYGADDARPRQKELDTALHQLEERARERFLG